jgi:predicted nucleic acid-binding Zn ribbon protein
MASAFPFKRIPPLGPVRVPSRQRVLAQWRGVDVVPLEKAQAVCARSIGSLLPKLLKDYRVEGRRADMEIVKVWNTLIDPNIVAHAQPEKMVKGTLFVNVDSSVWLSEIVRYKRKEILERLRHSFGVDVIKKISFRLGSVAC